MRDRYEDLGPTPENWIDLSFEEILKLKGFTPKQIKTIKLARYETCDACWDAAPCYCQRDD